MVGRVIVFVIVVSQILVSLKTNLKDRSGGAQSNPRFFRMRWPSSPCPFEDPCQRRSVARVLIRASRRQCRPVPFRAVARQAQWRRSPGACRRPQHPAAVLRAWSPTAPALKLAPSRPALIRVFLSMDMRNLRELCRCWLDEQLVPCWTWSRQSTKPSPAFIGSTDCRAAPLAPTARSIPRLSGTAKWRTAQIRRPRARQRSCRCWVGGHRVARLRPACTAGC